MNKPVDFTGSVDRDLLRRAKVIAAKLDTSVNALFRAELTWLVEAFESGEVHANANYRVLIEFSLGRIDAPTAMDSLGIDTDEDLFLLMASARLPMPRLPEERTDAMVEELLARHAG